MKDDIRISMRRENSIMELQGRMKLKNFKSVEFYCEELCSEGSFYFSKANSSGEAFAISFGRSPVKTYDFGGEIGKCPFEIIKELHLKYSFCDKRKTEIGEMLPFTGGLFGVFAYESYRFIEKIPYKKESVYGLPDIRLGLYDEVFTYYPKTHELIFSKTFFDLEEDEVNEALLLGETLIQEKMDMVDFFAKHYLKDKKVAKKNGRTSISSVDYEQYSQDINAVKEYIYAGDAFQVVYSRLQGIKTAYSGKELLMKLLRTSPSPYTYHINYGECEIIGASPERLVAYTNQYVTTNPIAGTRRRVYGIEALLSKELLNDLKECAEHRMLVDLGRNDIGRIAEVGTVKVEQLMEAITYREVIHLVSTVTGKPKSDVSAVDAFMACFPAGTVSGAPKIRAVEIIEGLETSQRSVYAGAIGFLGVDGEMDTCIGIRTMVLKDGTAYIQSGGGIVADSKADAEYAETETKAMGLKRILEVVNDDVVNR